MKLAILPLILSAGLISTFSANAATIGLGTPYGPHSYPDISYAVFDTFGANEDGGGALVLTNQAATSSGGDRFTSTLSVDMEGGLILGSGDRIYQGVGPGNAAFNLAIDGDVLNEILSLTLQIRFTQPDGIDFDDFFSVTLNGVSATGVTTKSSGIGSTGTAPNERNYGVVEFTWNDLNLDSGDDFLISILSPAAGHSSIDAIQIDAVPEPSTYALLTAAGVGLMVLRRKRARA